VTLAAIPFYALVRRQKNEADFFGGDRPEYACATPSIPAISQLAGDVTVEADPG
jgi:hypothetical protein